MITNSLTYFTPLAQNVKPTNGHKMQENISWPQILFFRLIANGNLKIKKSGFFWNRTVNSGESGRIEDQFQHAEHLGSVGPDSPRAWQILFFQTSSNLEVTQSPETFLISSYSSMNFGYFFQTIQVWTSLLRACALQVLWRQLIHPIYYFPLGRRFFRQMPSSKIWHRLYGRCLPNHPGRN